MWPGKTRPTSMNAFCAEAALSRASDVGVALVWAIMGVEVFARWDKIALCGLMPRSPGQRVRDIARRRTRYDERRRTEERGNENGNGEGWKGLAPGRS